jgi:DNA-binding NtrC family response regulator
MAILTEGDEIDVQHLPPSVFHEGYVPEDGTIPESSEELKQAKKEIREHSVEFIERAFVIKALERNGWNVTKASQEVDMQRSNFQALMRKYNVRSKLKDGEEE